MSEEAVQKTTAVKALEATKKVRPMIKWWSEKTHQSMAKDEPIAYYFTLSFYEDILRAMDIISVGTENYAALCAAKRGAERFLNKANSEGYASYLCSYAQCWLGFDALRQELGQIPTGAPDGGMPKPTVLLGTGMMICEPRYKGFQATQRYLDVPMHVFNLYWPPADAKITEVETYYVKYVSDELRDLVTFLEKYTNRKMNWDKLREVTDLIERTLVLWNAAYRLRTAVPAPMPTEDAMSAMVPGWFYMGTQEAYDFYQELYNEIKHRVDNKIGVIPNEKYRLLWGGGLPPWFIMKMFNYFESLGAVFPIEVTYHPPPVVEIPAGVTDPVERIAWRFFKQYTYRHEKAQKHTGHPDVEFRLELINDYKIDGVVFHLARTCRTIHCGQLHEINVLKNYVDIPVLILESDMVDERYYSETETKTRIEAFLESVHTYKYEKRKSQPSG